MSNAVRIMLTQTQRHHLNLWLQKNQGDIVKNRVPKSVAAANAASELKFSVNVSHIETSAEAVGFHWPRIITAKPVEKPQRFNGSTYLRLRAIEDRVARIEGMLESIAKELGVSVPESVRVMALTPCAENAGVTGP